MRKRRAKHDGRGRLRPIVAGPYALAKLQFEPLEQRCLLTGVPELLAEINSGGASDPAEFTNAGGVVFFRANDGTNGSELWKTDGMSGGTMMVKDINPLSAGSEPQYLTDVGGTLFFAADDGSGGVELWKSDGTEGGTMMVKDINPLGSSSPSQLTDVGGTLYFRADDGTNGAELWTSDGTPGGTVMVMNINPAGSSEPHHLTAFGGKLLFAADDGSNGIELWISDPGTASTTMVKDIRPGAASSSPGFFEGFTEAGGAVYFSASDGTSGFELWKSDGSTAGTMLVKDIRPGGDNSFPFVMTDFGGTLYFTATDGTNGFEFWTSDGTPGGTMMVKDINTTPGAGSNPDGFAVVNGTLYFRADDGANGTELWKSDGTTGGTQMVKDINPAGGSLPLYLTDVGGTLYFRADDGTNGAELWTSDGTPGGTTLVSDIAPLAGHSNPQHLTSVGGTLLFSAQSTLDNLEPWIARAPAASVVGTHLFYNQSFLDGDSAAANADDDSAIATDKVAYLPGSGTASFDNVSSYYKGINGVMIDLAGQHGNLSAADFTLQKGLSNTPENWPLAPAPVSVTVRAGAGTSGSDRVQLIWANGAIQKTWLQVIVKSNFNTNLDAPYTFLFGNITGETGIGNPPDALEVDASDQLATRNNQGEALEVTNVFDFDRDAEVNATDELIARDNQGFLPLLNAGAPPISTVLGRFLFYNQSAFDGGTAGADPMDDSAIAIDKSAYLADTGPATFDNMSSYVRGINGIMIDLSGSHPGITIADFTFKTGDDNMPATWAAAPDPTAVVVRAGAGTSGSDRVELIWANGEIRDTWLEVTVAANANTGLASPDVFYFGSRTGDTGSDTDPSAAVTDATDQLEVRDNHGDAISTDNPFDFDRDAEVNATDELITRGNQGFTIKIDLPAPPAAPLAAPAAGDSDAGEAERGLDAVASSLAGPNSSSETSAAAPSGVVAPPGPSEADVLSRAGWLDEGTGNQHPSVRAPRAVVEAIADRLMLDAELLDELLSELDLE